LQCALKVEKIAASGKGFHDSIPRRGKAGVWAAFVIWRTTPDDLRAAIQAMDSSPPQK